MIENPATLFGMRVVAAESDEEWTRALEAARNAGGFDVGNATRTDYDIVINDKAGVILVNPRKFYEVMQRMRDAIPERGPNG